ncbi:hypothetical protein KIN20_013916 [Parelaphostrongylus tenuis]|uniref:Uncharacterized protein n=1 Tax=Parelaphostrongylus tenuis TaxID=148309 RepID=A0AAD5MV57_PARTN|nr:hypothetical protein KIN20_013916 [Parelaphostrongylus tenuis]
MAKATKAGKSIRKAQRSCTNYKTKCTNMNRKALVVGGGAQSRPQSQWFDFAHMTYQAIYPFEIQRDKNQVIRKLIMRHKHTNNVFCPEYDLYCILCIEMFGNLD